MLAYRVTRWEAPAELCEVDVPRPDAGEVLVKVGGNGLCHSDSTMPLIPAAIGELLGWNLPFTLGHEIGGWIAGLGAGVDGLGEGDGVVLRSPASCGACRLCARGHESACHDGNAGRGYGRDGGLAEYVVAPARDVVKLQTLDPATAGPLTDAGATTCHAVKRVAPHLGPESTAIVIGAGGLGAFAIQLLRALTPARVIAVDGNPERLSYATELGADAVVAGVDDATPAALGELTEGLGAEAVLDLVGLDATIAAGIGATARAGAFGLIGAAGGTLRRPWYGALPRDAEIFTFQGSNLADLHDVIALAEAGSLRNEVEIYSLDRVADAYAALEAGTLRGRAVVQP